MTGMATAIDSTERRTRTLLDTDLAFGAKVATDTGWLEGYASVFNVIDSYDEVVRPGAFVKTIAERVPAGKVKLMSLHMAFGGDTMEVIGTITEAREDARGLWIHAEFASTANAQDARKLAVEGHVSGLSIGYNAITAAPVTENGKTIVELTELRLLEVTLTARPANELALVTDAKELTALVQAVGSPAPLGGRELSTEELGRLTACRDACSDLGGKIDALLTPPDTGNTAPAAGHADLDARRKWLQLQV